MNKLINKLVVAFLIASFFAFPLGGTENQVQAQESFPPERESQLSADGNTLYNADSFLVIKVDHNPEMQGIKVPGPTADDALADVGAASATFSITYVPAGGSNPFDATCETFPAAAKTAFNAAAAIWANKIQSSVPITIQACWADLGDPEILGGSGVLNMHGNFPGAPKANTWYYPSLANSIAGSDLDPSRYDDYIIYNSTFPWYFGTDGNPPAGQFDLVSVAAHEMAHGLNFAGTEDYSGGVGSYGWETGFPNVFDTFMESGSGAAVTSYTNPSTALGALFTSNNLWFDGPNAKAANGGTRVKMYAPPTWNEGSSYSHLDYSTFAGTVNSMMVYSMAQGSANHNPGPLPIGMLQDMGWSLVSASSKPTPISPTGTISDTTPTYQWTPVSGATRYLYELRKGTTVVYTKNVSSSVCGASTCSNTPTDTLSAGSYKWRVRAKVGDAWGVASAFKNFTVATVSKPTPISPTGTISDTTPTYQWTPVSGATRYLYELRKGTTVVYTKNVSSSVCGASTCSNTPTDTLSAGSYKWRVRAKVGDAWGVASAFKNFTVATVSKPTPISPTGTISDTTPTYQWTPVSGATRYLYELRKGTTVVYTKNVSSSVCGASTCSNTPTDTLSAGSYKWRVRAKVGDAWGVASAFKNFTVATVSKPTPISPTGTISDTTPTYQWTPVSGATRYLYELRMGTTVVYTKNVPSSVCGASTCSNTPAEALTAGAYKWRVRAQVGGVWGVASAFKNFMVASVPKPTPISPTGTITDKTPTYQWTPVNGATRYLFELRKGTTVVYTKNVPSSVCGASTCSKTPAEALSAGAYKWRVRAQVGGVWGVASAFKNFTVTVSNTNPQAGLWQGEGGAVKFYVTPNQANVDNFAIRISIPQCGLTVTIMTGQLVPIVNNHFSFSGNYYASGTFDTPTSAHGTVGLNNYPIYGCGSVSGSNSWTATWQNSSQPTAGLDSEKGTVFEIVPGTSTSSMIYDVIAP